MQAATDPLPGVDPFTLIVDACRAQIDVIETPQTWVVRCTVCGAGWIPARPVAGFRYDLGPMLQILAHVAAHTTTEAYK